MRKFDRYMLSQLLVMFGFFALILVALFWVNRAVVLFAKLIADGQSILVFLEFTILGLPSLVALVLPLASFGAALYLTNRMERESELTVMLAAGAGPWRMARPVFWFCAIAMMMHLLLSNMLEPAARAQLSEREAEIGRNVTARLLTEGVFLHPTSGVTFFLGEIDNDGTLRNVFVSDQTDPNRPVSYTAKEAYLVNSDGAVTLIMLDGLAQIYARSQTQLSTTRFADFSYDITALVSRDVQRPRRSREILTVELLRDPAPILQETGDSRAELNQEIHSRIAAPMVTGIGAVLGFATLLLGGYSRFGVWRQATFAFALLVVLELLRSSLTQTIETHAGLWPLAYVPPGLGLLLSATFLTLASRPQILAFKKRQSEVAP